MQCIFGSRLCQRGVNRGMQIRRSVPFFRQIRRSAKIFVQIRNHRNTTENGGGQNTDPQSMDYPNGLPKWTTLKWTTLEK